jgi:anti-sigma B factor antagonist
VESAQPLPRRAARPVVIAVAEQVDAGNAERIGDELRAALRSGAAVVVVNMSRTTFCDSAGAAALMLASEQAAAAHAELRLAVRSGLVLRTLQRLDAGRALAVFPSLGAALAGSPQTAAGSGSDYTQ